MSISIIIVTTVFTGYITKVSLEGARWKYNEGVFTRCGIEGDIIGAHDLSLRNKRSDCLS